MFGLQLKTVDRDAVGDNEDARAVLRSYVGMRIAIGSLGVALPVLLVLLDWFFVHTHRPIRGSMSAYYHSSARDVFVGGLIATGIFLISYMSAVKRTWDFVLSTVGGVLVVIVALVPTARSGSELAAPAFQPSGDSCDRYPGPPVCNGFENLWGENVARDIHQICASLFVLILVALAIVFALREFAYGPAAKELLGSDRNYQAVRRELKRRRVSLFTYLWKGVPGDGPGTDLPRPRRRVLAYVFLASIIVLSAIWATIGVTIALPWVGHVGRTYVGEFGAFISFGFAWLTASLDQLPLPIRGMTQKVAQAVDAVGGA